MTQQDNITAPKDAVASVVKQHAATRAALPGVTPFPRLDLTKKDAAVGRGAAGQALLTASGTETLYRYQALDGTVRPLAVTSAARSVASSVGRQIGTAIVRGVLGSLLGGRR